jgi:hypothetical protein
MIPTREQSGRERRIEYEARVAERTRASGQPEADAFLRMGHHW